MQRVHRAGSQPNNKGNDDGFCKRCKDRCWLITCTGCGGVLTRKTRWYDVRTYHKGHGGKGKSKYIAPSKNYCLYCRKEIPFFNKGNKPRKYCTEHHRKGIHGRPFKKGQTSPNKKKSYSFDPEKKNYCKYCNAEIPWLNRHYDIQSYCKGHENKRKNPIWINDNLDRQIIPLRDTSIELRLQDKLSTLGIPFQKHKPFRIRNFIHQVDIFIEPNICIEADGVRWHTMLVNFNSKMSPLNRDYIIDYELEKRGMKVLRFWQEDIEKHLGWCTNLIMITLKQLRDSR